MPPSGIRPINENDEDINLIMCHLVYFNLLSNLQVVEIFPLNYWLVVCFFARHKYRMTIIEHVLNESAPIRVKHFQLLAIYAYIISRFAQIKGAFLLDS